MLDCYYIARRAKHDCIITSVIEDAARCVNTFRFTYGKSSA